jgi:predicted membrane-bound spermidine synthase
MESAVTAMAKDLEEKTTEMDPTSTVVLVQLFDKSIYECKLLNGYRELTRKGRDNRYHAEGELSVCGKDTLQDLFTLVQLVLKVVKGIKTILMIPLLLNLWNRCCSNLEHIVNLEKPGMLQV